MVEIYDRGYHFQRIGVLPLLELSRPSIPNALLAYIKSIPDTTFRGYGYFGDSEFFVRLGPGNYVRRKDVGNEILTSPKGEVSRYVAGTLLQSLRDYRAALMEDSQYAAYLVPELSTQKSVYGMQGIINLLNVALANTGIDAAKELELKDGSLVHAIGVLENFLDETRPKKKKR